MRSVLGMVNVARKIISNLAATTAPLVALTKKEAINEVSRRWGPERFQAFTRVERFLTEAPILLFPDFSKYFVIHVDVNNAGAGAFLAQQNGDDVNKIQ